MHKYQGKYYLTYPRLYQNEWPKRMYYVTADHPLGPGTDSLQYDRLYTFPQSDTWHTIEIATVRLQPGENYIRFYNGAGEIKPDAILLEQILQPQKAAFSP